MRTERPSGVGARGAVRGSSLVVVAFAAGLVAATPSSTAPAVAPGAAAAAVTAVAPAVGPVGSGGQSVRFNPVGMREPLAAPVPERVLPPVTTTALPGTAAARAIEFALAQRGLPYVWGGDGPRSGEGGFDCSGLTTAAYAHAGLALPRTAHTQYHAGPHVPAGAELMPGDLVFYGVPERVHHVGLYLGGGQMVNAPRRGKPVQIAYVRYAGDDYLGATRPAAGVDATGAGLVATPDLPVAVPPVPSPAVPPAPEDFLAPPVPAGALAVPTPTPPVYGPPAPVAPPPGPAAPGPAMPSSTPPGSTVPGSTAPGSTLPGSPSPGSTSPTSTAPGSTPGSTTPDGSTPGRSTPGSSAPGSGTAPGAPVPAPAAPAPGSTAPGSTPRPAPPTTTPPRTSPPATTPPAVASPVITPVGAPAAPAVARPSSVGLPGGVITLARAEQDANGLPAAPASASTGGLRWSPAEGIRPARAVVSLHPGAATPATGATLTLRAADGTVTTLTVRSSTTVDAATAGQRAGVRGDSTRLVLVRQDPATGRALIVIAE